MTLAFLVAFPLVAGAATLQKEELRGTWVPSGEMPRDGSVAEYTFTIEPDMSATYEAQNDGALLKCQYKPSSTQNSVFIWYCYLNEQHLITLSLAGWRSESGSLLFGYEYWLGHPEPGQIHGGLPVSLKPANL
jgi:hypothetical protein